MVLTSYFLVLWRGKGFSRDPNRKLSLSTLALSSSCREKKQCICEIGYGYRSKYSIYLWTAQMSLWTTMSLLICLYSVVNPTEEYRWIASDGNSKLHVKNTIYQCKYKQHLYLLYLSVNNLGRSSRLQICLEFLVQTIFYQMETVCKGKY